MEIIKKAIALKQELDSLRPLKPEDERRIMQKFRLDWNYHSNHLEGNSLTYGETKALLMFGITARAKPLKDHFEVTGHNEAIDLVLDVVKDQRPITEAFIRELHKLLLKESYEVDAVSPNGVPVKKKVKVGEYKSTPNHVLTKTGEMFYFATPEETPAKMTDLIDWYRQKEAEVEPILLAAKFHYKFIRIHPFDDGNGRTARILMNFILMRFGYPPVIVKTEDKENYFAALQQADAGIEAAFEEYIAENLVHSLEIMIKGAQGESIDDPDDLDKELALLDQRLKEVGGKDVEVVKTKEVVYDYYEKSIVHLIEKYLTAAEKFDKYYLESPNTVEMDGVIYSNWLILFQEFVEKGGEKITFSFNYNSLNKIKVRSFNYATKLIIEFNKTDVSIFGRDRTLKITKLYNEQLTQEEIKQIVDHEMKLHIDAISKQLDESSD